MKEHFMKQAIKEAKKAFDNDEVPNGAVIVLNDKIIAKAYNKKEKRQMVTEHAEILAIQKASKKLKTWHLDDCTLYTTMEPCMMCTGAIIQSRINKIVYSVSNENFGNIENNNYFKKNKIEIIKHIQKEKNLKLLQQFFQNKRN